jgi:rhodanese-related sulfurtransferase
VGALIADVNQTLLLVAPKGQEEEAITRLSRVGFDQTIGYLKGGFETWTKSGKETDSLSSIPADKLKKELSSKETAIFDVRKESEFTAEHLPQSINTPLGAINEHLASFPENKTFYLSCAGGYRSVIAASILKSRGIHNLVDVGGGFSAIKLAGIETSSYVCPSTL